MSKNKNTISKTNTNPSTASSNASHSTDMANADTTEIYITKRSPFVRIMAIVAIIILLSMYVVSIIAAVSDWENSFEIFLTAAASTIILPVLIYIIQLFGNMKKRD